MSEKGTRIYDIIRRFGYDGVESILNEWNYVRGWGDEWIYSIEQMISIKGASFICACMCSAQLNPDIDMLMYYDARPCAMNGLFDFYTMRALKGYYSIVMFSHLFELKNQVMATSDDEDIYTVCASNGEKSSMLACYYTDDDNEIKKTVNITFEGADMNGAKIYIVDADRSMALCEELSVKDNSVTITLMRNSFVLIEK